MLIAFSGHSQTPGVKKPDSLAEKKIVLTFDEKYLTVLWYIIDNSIYSHVAVKDMQLYIRKQIDSTGTKK